VKIPLATDGNDDHGIDWECDWIT